MNQIRPVLSAYWVRDERKILEKLDRFRHDGPDKLQLVLDFDHTLTAGKVPSENIGTWNLFDYLMPSDVVRRHDELYERFRPKEITGEMTDEEAVTWWSESLGLIVESKIKLAKIEELFLKEIRARAGVKDLFDYCNGVQVPIIILSAGVKQIIEMILEKYQLRADKVLATELTVDEDGIITGWSKGTLIHNLNKREVGHSELSALREARPNAMLAGDGPTDSDMVGGEAIRIRVLDPRKGESVDEEKYKRESFEAGFDLVIRDSLLPMKDLVKWIVNR
jgi:HAD superfamily phosphoserine phosphatase-like hydrolase